MLKQLLLCAHRNTDLYWCLADGSPSCLKVSGIITEWLLPLLVELNIPTLSGVKSGHSLRPGDASSAHAFSASRVVIMAWGLWKSLASALLFYHASCLWKHQSFGKLSPAEASPIDFSDAMEALLEFDA